MAYLRLHQSVRWRLVFLLVFFAVAFLAILSQVFRLAIIDHRQYLDAAEKQHTTSEALFADRGQIFFQDKQGERYPAALNRSSFTLVASPRDVKDPAHTASELSRRLGIDRQLLFEKLKNQDDVYDILAKDLSAEDMDEIQALEMSGISFERGSRRVYPNKELGASVVGFVRSESGRISGEYGIEKQYQRVLEGESGFFEGERDASGLLVALGRRVIRPPVNGSSVVLTIDRNIQFALEEELALLMKKWKGESASAIIIEPATGRILALAVRPVFDPNEYSKERDYSVFRMPIMDSQYELGSVFKPITMAAALNEGKIRPETTYSDPGLLKFGAYTIRNFDGKAYGVQTMTQVLEKSLNTGAVYAERLLGGERFRDYVRRFGFGKNVGIDFPSEISGNIENVERGADLELATASFGQGIAVTPLQMVSAIAAIANGGVRMQPYLVEKVISDSGNEAFTGPKKIDEPIRGETAETLTKMLVSAVRNGFENHAGVPGYFVAGKTGTAQIPRSDRRGYSDEVIHTFVGYAPAFHPKFVALFQLNKPRGVSFASSSLTPSFRKIAEFILNYYEIPPDEK